MSIQNLLHPIHSNLANGTGRPMHIIGQLINDPWYTNHALRTLGGTHGTGRNEQILVPDFDVRESDECFFLEGEFAGIASKNQLNIQWIAQQTLVIKATIYDIDVETEWDLHPYSKPMIAEAEAPEAKDGIRSNGHHGNSKGERSGHGRAMKLWMNERHKGNLQKSFTFPCDVDTANMRAKLTNGLLKIMVPKIKSDGARPSGQVQIED